MGNYMSFNAAGDGAGRVGEYVTLFIKNIPLTAYLLLTPFILFIILFKFRKTGLVYEKKNKLTSILIVLLVILVHTISILSLNISDKNQIKTNKQIYKNPTLIEVSLVQFGSTRFMWLDVLNIFVDTKDEGIIIDDKDPIEEVPTDYTRYIDDTAWNAMIEAETNSTIKNLHQFYINQNITPKNDYTGIFKDKNLVLVMVEAFDYLAINKDITPTLYKMQQEGWFFNNYYTPKYSCTTGESEWIAEVSLIPAATVCTPNTYLRMNYSTSIFNMFNKSDYYSSSYHNWWDQYYARTIYHPRMGAAAYYDRDDLNISRIAGWPSDLEMVEKSLPHFIDQEKFFSFMITSSTHFPYDEFTGVVKKNFSVVEPFDYPSQVKYYLSKAVELDNAMAKLISSLEEKGKLDDTVIVLFGDHHPLHMNLDYLKQYSGINRSDDQNLNKLPFIIYNSATEPKVFTQTASTFDIIPTLGNLFDLNYDPRLYVGKDIMSNDEKIVIFTNGSWITDRAMYFASDGSTKIIDPTVDEQYILDTNKKVSDYMYVSDKTLTMDYFKYLFKK